MKDSNLCSQSKKRFEQGENRYVVHAHATLSKRWYYLFRRYNTNQVHAKGTICLPPCRTKYFPLLPLKVALFQARNHQVFSSFSPQNTALYKKHIG